MNDSKCLRRGHAGLFLCESVQSLYYRLDLAIPQQLLRELLYNTFRNSRRQYRYRKAPLTDPSSANLFLRYGEYRNQLNHDVRDDARHQIVQGDLRINMKTIEEASEAIKELEEGVIARAYSISGL